ncbi:MAG: DUF2339 domain-containing protein [Paenibacillaceae bacterium]|nr:DUF2339 domain-containing protein [Paenibacillaceae bacterium]
MLLPLLKKQWTSLLGVLLVLTAFITLFRYSLDRDWITDPLKIGAGLLLGIGLAIAGIAVAKRQTGTLAASSAAAPSASGQTLRAAGDIVIGLGACILYATISFAGIYFDLWSPMTVLLGMTAVTVLLSYYAFRDNSRLVMNVALVGGLLSPLFMQPETDQVFTLFLYLLVVNVAFFLLSIAKGWEELRSAAFIGTWLIYAVYFVHFSPETEGVWTMPVRYATAAFVFYLIGFLLASWRNGRRFDGWNLYLSATNVVLFGCWSSYLLNGDLPLEALLSFIGLVCILTGFVVYRLAPGAVAFLFSHGAGGALLLLIAAAQLGDGLETKPLVSALVWGAIASLLAAAGRSKRWKIAEFAAIAVWAAVGVYWYVVTWETPRGEWFGTYIPFLNWGAVSWMLLAALGFYFSLHRTTHDRNASNDRLWTNLFALFAHLIVGGLLTVQIQSAFEEYGGDGSGTLLSLTLSCVWGLYALTLFLWGSYYKQKLFVIFGSVVLVIVACKAILFDLYGEQTIYKAAMLLVLGLLSFAISWVRGKWTPPAPIEPAPEEEAQDGIEP